MTTDARCIYMSAWKKFLLASWGALVFAGGSDDTVSPLKEAPSAQDLLYRTRYAIYLEDTELEGNLRKGWKKTPVTFSLSKGVVSMKIQPSKASPWELGVDIKEAQPTLWIKEAGKSRAPSVEEFGDKVAGTDFTIEDLAMRFLYWNDAEFRGEEELKGQHAKIIRVQNPLEEGSYQWVDLWILPESGTLMQMEAYNSSGQKITRYRILNVMKIKGRYQLERLKIEALKPETGKVESYSYLQFEKPRQSGISRIKGLR